MHTVILGIGNTLLSDDGVGVYIARELKEKLKDNRSIEVKEAFSPGFELVEELIGFKRAIIVDAILLKEEKIGEILRYTPESFQNAIHISTYHDMNFPTALELSKKLKLDVPAEIVIFAVNVQDILTLREECTDEVKSAIPKAVEMIMKEVKASDA